MPDETLATATAEPTTAPASEPTPPTPTVDTSIDLSDLLEVSIKPGTHRVLSRIIDFAPYKTMEGTNIGWQLGIVTCAPLVDEKGGEIPAGKRFSYLKYYTTPGNFDSDGSAPAKRVKRAILALNNIAVKTRSETSLREAALVLNALPPEKRLPLAVDDNPGNFEQWKETLVVAVLKASIDKEGEPSVKLVALDAASTAAAS